MIAEDPKSAEIIRPILRGRDIKRYGYYFADLWLINTHNGIKEKGIKPVNIEDYPAVKKHLDSYYDSLKKRFDKGDTPYNLRNCAYMDDFNKQKITWGNLNLNASFTFAPPGYFINAPSALIVSDSNFLLVYLNSKVADYYIRSLGVSRNGGYFEYKPMFVEKLPIPLIFSDVNVEFRVQNLLRKKVESFENEINQFIFKIFDLTDEEMRFIDSQ